VYFHLYSLIKKDILVTGNVYKPSDQRIKSDITEVDSNTQLANVRNLKIYDYIVRSQQERGGIITPSFSSFHPLTFILQCWHRSYNPLCPML
jgi:hypothetical protein